MRLPEKILVVVVNIVLSLKPHRHIHYSWRSRIEPYRWHTYESAYQLFQRFGDKWFMKNNPNFRMPKQSERKVSIRTYSDCTTEPLWMPMHEADRPRYFHPAAFAEFMEFYDLSISRGG